MRLVIDPQHIQQLVMVCGSVELPITREQCVEMLFGGEYKLVRVDGKEKAASKTKSKKEPVEEKRERRKRRASPQEMARFNEAILSALAKPMRMFELAEALGRVVPPFNISQMNSMALKNVVRLIEIGKVKREGDKPHVYTAVSSQAPKSDSAVVVEAMTGQHPRGLRHTVLGILQASNGALSQPEIRIEVNRLQPEEENSPAAKLAGALHALLEDKLIRRTGERGSFRYGARVKKKEETNGLAHTNGVS